MSGETEAQPSAWTIDSLKQHVDTQLEALEKAASERDRRYEQRFDAQEKAVERAFATAERADDMARAALEKRLDNVNEFRDQQRDLIQTFMPRAEAESQIADVGRQLAEVKGRLDLGQGRASGLNAGWGYLAGAAGVAAAIAAIVAR